MLRYPDVSQSQIVFVYANDLWLVDRAGGMASPLASPAGAERNPRFSADGKTIAFMGNYEGDSDIYTMSASGDLPFRVTHRPGGETLTDWTADGRLVFSTSASAGIRRAAQMFTVPATGGLPEKVSVPYGANGTINANGRMLAYTPNARDNRNWKRYKGGTATDIWLFDLQDKSSRRVTTFEGTDSFPMWHGDDLYFISDRGADQRLNIWKFDAASGTHIQITNFTDFDVKWPAIGPGDKGQGEIVFQNNSGLFLTDLGTGQTRQVQVQIPGARETVRPRMVDVSSFVRAADISSTGKRVSVEARGDIWTLPAEKGKPRNLTNTNGVGERDPSWSPDGRWVAYFSDVTGEYELTITQSDGRGETRQLTKDTEGYKYQPTWSPDSGQIAFSDRSGTIYLHNIEAGTTTRVDQHGSSEWGVGVNWSHDSRWLTFSTPGDDAMTTSIMLYDTKDSSLHRVTSDMFNDSEPVFDRKGDYLYFYSVRNFSGQRGSAIDSNYVYENAEVLLAVPLRNDVEFPWTGESDEESWDDEETEEDDSAEEEAEEGTEEGTDEEATPDDGVSGSWSGSLEILGMGKFDFSMSITLSDGSFSGSVTTPMGNGAVSGTVDAESGECSGQINSEDGQVLTFVGKLAGGSLEWALATPDGDAEMKGERSSRSTADGDDDDKADDKPAEVVEIDIEGFEHRALLLPVTAGSFNNLAVNDKGQLLYNRQGNGGGIKLYDIDGDDQAEKSVTDGGRFTLSSDGKKLMTMRGRTAAIGKAGEGSSPKSVKTDGMDTMIDARQEWPQIYTDAWRLFRDYFYAENMHGVDWKAVHDQYRPMIDFCVTRNDVDYVLREIVSELNCGHTYVRGGPMERGPRVGVGLLGCDYTLENGAIRISKFIEGGIWDVDARGPLSRTGVDVNEGDYLLAVDGKALDASQDPWAAFLGKADKTVELTVSSLPTMDDTARRVRVKTLSSEANLRYRSWIESNRAAVEKASGGRVGYVYVPDTGQNGRNNFFRQLYGQAHLDALIVDERWNGGGSFPNREIEALNRPRTNYWGRRWGRDWPTPADSHQGPKCMLINRDAGSGGDMFPYLFRQAGLGKLIGTRTWGGLVGYSGSPALIDGATLAIPSFGFYELDGTWGVEGHGVSPDIEVMDDPALMQNGADPQLAAGVAQMLKELATAAAYNPPARPKNPVRTGMGAAEIDR
ncbi:MAG: tricorn protease [Planctomycetota bacterium]|jgi:tricorn protease